MGRVAPEPLDVLESRPERRRVTVAIQPRVRALDVLLILVLPAAVFAGLVYWSLRTQGSRPKRNGPPPLRIST